MPRMMREIVEAELLAQPDMTLVGAPDTADGLVDEVRGCAPDFVLIGAEHSCALPQLFDEHPWMRVLEIEPRAAAAHLYELRPRRVNLGPVTAAELVTTIRDAALAPRWATDGC